MMEASEIDGYFVREKNIAEVPLWFDIKAMQMRIREVVCDHHCDHLEFILNRPVKVKTPCPVWFKAGEDCGKCIEVRNGTHFIFEGGPAYEVRAGESIHIRNPELQVGGPVFLDYELEKIEKVRKMGLDKFYLSYVWSQDHVDQFREVAGPDAELILKIENKIGLHWVANGFKRQHRTNLAAARGDMYVEIDYPHEINKACRLIIEKDPGAFVGSRMLLSLAPVKCRKCGHLHDNEVPSCADFSDLAWLYEIGYRNFLLCDELCLQEDLLAKAVNVFDAFRSEL
jgi:pyruvate kinase